MGTSISMNLISNSLSQKDHALQFINHMWSYEYYGTAAINQTHILQSYQTESVFVEQCNLHEIKWKSMFISSTSSWDVITVLYTDFHYIWATCNSHVHVFKQSKGGGEEIDPFPAFSDSMHIWNSSLFLVYSRKPEGKFTILLAGNSCSSYW